MSIIFFKKRNWKEQKGFMKWQDVVAGGKVAFLESATLLLVYKINDCFHLRTLTFSKIVFYITKWWSRSTSQQEYLCSYRPKCTGDSKKVLSRGGGQGSYSIFPVQNSVFFSACKTWFFLKKLWCLRKYNDTVFCKPLWKCHLKGSI